MHDLVVNKQVSVDEYGSNLESIVLKLKEIRARLIFVTTTPVPKGAKNREFDAQIPYNNIAKNLMGKHGVEVCDLEQKLVEENQMDKYQLPNNVHFNELGNLFNGFIVTSCILKH